MRISVRWLGRHVDLEGLTPEQIAADLTLSTAETEGVTPFGHGLDDLVVGHVQEVERHPDADKLSVCRVALGNEEAQIVCGAPNVAAGQRVAVIRPGSRLPDVGAKAGMKVKQARIRGVSSSGMICSESELGLSEDHEGILVLPGEAEPGTPFVEAVDVRDHVIEIDNKSVNHRPDLWGHYGFARELAAIHGRALRPVGEPVPLPTGGERIDVRIEDPEACPRYVGLCLADVRIGRSPDWLRYLLHAVGQRSIDLVVDLTNFVMLDLGQPLHAFDRRRLRSGSIGIRRARAGETMTTLDGQERPLDPADLLITDGPPGEDVPVALAGVMGGEGTMVDPDTSDLFLESANFHPATVRRTSVRLGLRTDASARFEKGQDPANAERAVHHFTGLLGELCPGARPAGPLVDPAGWRFEAPTLVLRRARLDLKLGVHVPDQEVYRILKALRFDVARHHEGFAVTVPSFRATKDITIEDDLIEEVGRMHRYDRIPEQPLVSVVEVPERDEELATARRLVELGAAELHANEVYSYSFQSEELLAAVGADGLPHGVVANPVAPEWRHVRRHVLPSLLPCAVDNLRRTPVVRLMEHGKGYHPEEGTPQGPDRTVLPRELRELALVWSVREGAHPYGALRSGVGRLLERVGHEPVLEEAMDPTGLPWIHPGRTVAVEVGGDRARTAVGYVGSLHPEVCRRLGLPLTTAVGSVDVRELVAVARAGTRYRPIPRFPSQPVDVALRVPDRVRVAEVAAFLRKAGRKLVRDVALFEVYRGEGLPPGHKSLNFTVTLGAPDRTLSAADEEKFLQRVREACGEVGAELRG